MDDSEKTTDSMLLEEAMADTENSSQEATALCEDGTDEAHDELGEDSLGMVQDGALVEGVMENDAEMADDVAEDSENNNLAPEDSMDAPVALLEGEDESGDVSQGTLSTSEAFLGDQFISQTDSMIVQSEPPQQLMEEADLPGEGEVAEGMSSEAIVGAGILGEVDIVRDGVLTNETDTTNEPSHALVTDQTGDDAEGDEESILLHQEEEGTTLVPQSVAGNDLSSLPEGMTLAEMSSQMEVEADAVEHLNDDGTQDTEGLEDDDEHAQGGMVLRLDESETENGTREAEDGAETMAMLAAGEHLEGVISDLEGKIAAANDAAHLAAQENLQGMQLMEGDEKPEEEAEGEAAQQEIQAQLNAALMKQEEMKTEDEDHPEADAVPDGQPSSEADGLAALASAALDHQAPTNGVKTELDDSQIKTESDSQEPQWMDVGICKGTHCQVRSYYIPRPGQSWDQNWEGITTSTLPDHRALAKLELESGKAYKFRVAAINSCGRGPWSEVAAFKTSLPGFPGAPSAIKIAKTTDGAHLSWEPPPIASGVIEDYHVYLAVRTATTDSRVVSSGTNQLAFVRIYQGAANQCTVGNDTLSKAHIDMTTKPAILFRISARNEKGIGPATQVRWLQEVSTPSNPTKPAHAPRRPAETKPHGNYKRKKSE